MGYSGLLLQFSLWALANNLCFLVNIPALPEKWIKYTLYICLGMSYALLLRNMAYLSLFGIVKQKVDYEKEFNKLKKGPKKMEIVTDWDL